MGMRTTERIITGRDPIAVVLTRVACPKGVGGRRHRRRRWAEALRRFPNSIRSAIGEVHSLLRR